MRQIIALGGGGFSTEPENPQLDRYILKQTEKPLPEICFIPTASGDAQSYIEKFYLFFEKEVCLPSHLSLFKPPAGDLREFIFSKDILYVGGGNTKNLLALWKDWGLDVILKEAWERGIVLAGISAGSLCWFEEGLTDSRGGNLEPLACLGFLKGSNCPHYHSEPERRPAYLRFIESREMKPGIAVDNGVALHYIEQEMRKIVSSRPDAKAYNIYYENGVKEELLKTEYLGV